MHELLDRLHAGELDGTGAARILDEAGVSGLALHGGAGAANPTAAPAATA